VEVGELWKGRIVTEFLLFLLRQPFYVGEFDDDKTERTVITGQK
jgi:hypothetical protein